MPNQLYEDDEEYVELTKEYERYMRGNPGSYEDFDEWFEIEYGQSRKKTVKHPRKKRSKDNL